MPKRPLSVTLVAFCVLLSAAFNFLTLSSARQNPAALMKALPPGMTLDDVSRAIPLAMFACVLVAFIGIGLLRGLNWARIALVAVTIFAVLMSVLQGNMILLLSAGLQALMAFVLYRPAAGQFFAHKRRGAAPLEGRDDGTPPGTSGSSGTFVA